MYYLDGRQGLCPAVLVQVLVVCGAAVYNMCELVTVVLTLRISICTRNYVPVRPTTFLVTLHRQEVECIRYNCVRMYIQL